MRITYLVVLAFALLPAAPAQEQSGQVFKSGVTMIQVPVVVRDRDGRVVGNLEKGDFQLFDDGKRVEIANFSVESAGGQAPDRSLPGSKAAAPAPNAAAMDIPERFIAYFFDDVSFRDQGDLTRLREAVSRQLGALQPGDRAAIFTSSCHLMVDFTNDRAKLPEVVARLELRPPPVCQVSRADVLQVEVLGSVVRRMSTLPARRDIILVSPGFWVGHYRSPEEASLVEAAIRAKVVINSVDLGETTDYTGGGGGSADPRSELSRSAIANPTNPLVLVELARGTGGAYVTGNDYGVSLRKLATPESHYVLGFVSTAKADGSLHHLKVKLDSKRKLKVEAREEYYAPQRPQ